MIKLIIFGAPGAGKGTQAKKIAEIHQLHHLSTGDLFRKEIKNKTDLGIEAKKYSSKGGLVPDSLVIEILKKEIEKHPKRNAEIQAVLALEVPDQELIKRIKNRAKNSSRVDDQNEEIINNRLEIYQKDTKPLLDYYQEQDKVYEINGLGDIDKITDRLNKVIDNLE
jgi:adenylate kinase